MWYSLCKGANFNFVLYVQFCGRTDKACEWLVCRLGNLEAGREVTIQLEANLNPAVLRQAPVTHSHAGDWFHCILPEFLVPDAFLCVSGSPWDHDPGKHGSDVIT